MGFEEGGREEKITLLLPLILLLLRPPPPPPVYYPLESFRKMIQDSIFGTYFWVGSVKLKILILYIQSQACVHTKVSYVKEPMLNRGALGIGINLWLGKVGMLGNKRTEQSWGGSRSPLSRAVRAIGRKI